jgi:hypothetical protein
MIVEESSGEGGSIAGTKTIEKSLPKACNHMVLNADEILINLQTVVMPTNSTGCSAKHGLYICV